MKLMESDISVLIDKDQALRTYIDIPEIDKDVRKLGIGGNVIHKTNELDKLIHSGDIKISELSQHLDKLERELKLERLSYEEIYNAFKHNSNKIQCTPSTPPVNEGYITDGFGYRRDPFTQKWRFHYGMDFSAPLGTPVYSTANGVVRDTRRSSTYGKFITIDHGFG